MKLRRDEFGTCICSNVETILSLTCHVYGPFEFRTSLGTSILLAHDPLQVLLFFGQIRPGADQGRGKNR